MSASYGSYSPEREAPPRQESPAGRRKHARTTYPDEASFLPSNDRNEWYFPTARQYDGSLRHGTPNREEGVDREQQPGSSQDRSSEGNWGNKLLRGSRWARRGKIVPWGPTRSDWDMEDRARKRLRTILPSYLSERDPESASSFSPRRSRSVSPVTLPHLRRSPTPPLTAAYSTDPHIHQDLTSFILDPAVQHAFTNDSLTQLGGSATELISGEAGLRQAFGRLWSAIQGERHRLDQERNTRIRGGTKDKVEIDGYLDDLEDEEDEDDDDPRRPSVSLQRVFVSEDPIVVPSNGSSTSLETNGAGHSSRHHKVHHVTPQAQLENAEWALAVLRELSDDGKEYTSRLEEIRDGLGRANAVRNTVWNECRLGALEEMAGLGPPRSTNANEDS